MSKLPKTLPNNIDPQLIPTSAEDIPSFVWELHVRGLSLRQIGQLLGISHETVRRKLQEFKRNAFDNVTSASANEIVGDSILFLQKLRQQFLVDANLTTSSALMKYNNSRAAIEVHDKLIRLYYEQGILNKSVDSKSDLEKRLDKMSKGELEARKQELLDEIMEAEEASMSE